MAQSEEKIKLVTQTVPSGPAASSLQQVHVNLPKNNPKSNYEFNVTPNAQSGRYKVSLVSKVQGGNRRKGMKSRKVRKAAKSRKVRKGRKGQKGRKSSRRARK